MNGTNKLYSIMVLFLLFSVVSVIGVTIFILNFGITNDYILYELQDQTEYLEDESMLPTGWSNFTMQFGESYQERLSLGDIIWFVCYLMFLLSTFMTAYLIRDSDDISLFMFLLYGIIIFLFLIYVVSTFSNWFIENITEQLIPNAMSYFPMFNYYLTNIGIISLVHAIILLSISKFNFNFARKKQINDAEVNEALKSDEVF